MILDFLGQGLERGRGRPAAARACRDDRQELAEAHGLQQFLRDLDLKGAIAAGFGCQRNADGVADTVLQQDAEWRGSSV